ncbi:MAG: CDP-alcohol phosphatidyltransferase family protein [Verrucomicrobiota bacterium]
MAMPQEFHLISEEPSPRFLGITVAERNARVARRANVLIDAGRRGEFPTLTVPAGVAITSKLIALLPPPHGLCRLRWEHGMADIEWRGAGAAETSMMEVSRDSAFDVSTVRARWCTTWRLLQESGKATDRWLARNFDRKFSRPLSFVFVHLGLTPNGATFITFLIGLTSAWLMTQTSHATMIAGAIVFWFASIFDGVDGEIARLKLTDSAWGEKLDTAVDQVTYLAVFAGIMIGAWRQGIGPLGWLVTLMVAAGGPLLLLWLRNFEREAATGHREVFVDKPVEVGINKAARAGAPALQIAACVFTLFRRESFSLVFIPISLWTDRRAVFIAVVGGALLFVAIMLLVYREAIQRAMRLMYAEAADQLTA